jgi:ABC-type polysaccharide/polyol phosphate export permease
MKNYILLKLMNFTKTINSIVYSTALSKFWLIYVFLLPIIIPIFFFTQIYELKLDEAPYIIFYLTGFLAFSISFSGYRFAVRSLFLTRKRYYINIRQPLDIFDKYYDLNLLFFTINFFILLIAIFFYKIGFDNFSILNFFLSSLLSYYFGKSYALITAFYTILLKDIRFIGRNLVVVFLLLSSIPFKIPDDKPVLSMIVNYNPLSVAAEGFRKSIYLPDNLVSLNMIIYMFVVYLIYSTLRRYILKNIYKFYAL